MEIQATSQFIRVTPRKMQLLVKGIKSMHPSDAVVTLSYLKKSGAMPLKKVILSALANAKNKSVSDTKNLEFKKIEILTGPVMKRFRPVSRGMAHQYKKRMSHIKVVLTENKSIKDKNVKASSALEINKQTTKIQNPES